MFKEANYHPLHALLAFNYKSKTSTPPKYQRSMFSITYALRVLPKVEIGALLS